MNFGMRSSQRGRSPEVNSDKNMTEIEAGNNIWRAAFRVVLAYAFFAGLWILLSDRAMGLLFRHPDLLVQASMAKGWLFVAVTSMLLYVLVRRHVGQIIAAHRRELELMREQQYVPAMLESISENTDDAIFVKDLEGRYLLLNQAAARFVGKPAEDVLGHDDRGLFPPEQVATLMAIDRRVIETGVAETNEEVVSTPGGERVFLATKGPLRDTDGNVFGIFGISRDITLRKHAENALHERDHRLEAIIGHSPSALSLKYPDGRYALANPNLQRIHHLSEAQIIGKTDFDLYPEEIARIFQANDRRVLETMTRHSIEEVVLVDGIPRTYMSHLFPVLDDAGRAEYICRISLDITESKTAQENLQRLADDMGATLRAIPDLLFELDAEGYYLDVKATQEALLAATADQLLGRTVSDVLPREAAETVMAAIKAAGQAGTDYGRTITLPISQGPGYFEISVARKAVVAGQGDRYIVLSRDITARKTVEEQLRMRNAELERFNRATVNRELDMLEMKKTINALSQELGRTPPYPLDFLKKLDGDEG